MATPLSERSGVLGAFARFYRRTYLGDYIGFVLLQAAYFITKFLITPVHRPFLISDLRISHEYADPERVTTYENFLYAGVGPLVVIVLYCVAVRPGFHRSHVTILGFLFSLSFSGFLTHVFKNAIGRARPDLLARCVIKKGTPADVLVTISVCEQTDQYKLNDGWRSFPSGHSSFAWAGLGYLSLFLAGQLHTLRPRTDLARVLVTVCPLLGAFLVAASRTADYRHVRIPMNLNRARRCGSGSSRFMFSLTGATGCLRRDGRIDPRLRCCDIWIQAILPFSIQP
jgi:diacylglycerol diphosphate phosphatase / phosphatidate phosphatase